MTAPTRPGTLAAPDAAPAADAGRAGASGLARLLAAPETFPAEEEAGLTRALSQGLAFYTGYNTSRLELAFASFDEDMKLAFYELLFLLHVNDPRLADLSFTARRFDRGADGRLRTVEEPATAELYLAGAPAGVRGMEALPGVYVHEYEDYIRATFSIHPYGEGKPSPLRPIVSLLSVGSTGTIGHKPQASDLDMQVIYDLAPFTFAGQPWSEGAVKEALRLEQKWLLRLLQQQRKLSPEALADPAQQAELRREVSRRIAAGYPGLARLLAQGSEAGVAALLGAEAAPARRRVVDELFRLMKRADRLARLGGRKRAEALLKERLARIQAYLEAKFPAAEIYLFVYPVEQFRQARYGSTLEFKESSGSAYELILNHETLMPGIQFIPMVPVHFVVPEAVNNDVAAYDRLVDRIRFRATGVYGEIEQRLVDLGAAPDLSPTYVAQHGGAIYWEAFKASAGNLPKAILNLFRFEMLLDPRFLKTIIQLIKQPGALDAHVTPKPDNPLRQQVLLGQMQIGLPPWAVLEMEGAFPALRADPWWLRYKALKIAFAEPAGVEGPDAEERARISKVLDQAFCLHLRVSDVLEQAGPPTGYRQQVMADFLQRAFPPDSPRRLNLDTLLSGSGRGLYYFEQELRDLFRRSMTRVEQKMARLGVRDHVGESREVELWLNYYLEHFQPPPNIVPRIIMKHLKTPRARIEITFRGESGWRFEAVQADAAQRGPGGAARAALTRRVTLLEDCGFAIGLAHCIVNGYYGPLPDNPEARTTFQVDPRQVHQGSEVHDRLATLTGEEVDELARRINAAFPYRYVNYRDIVLEERRVTEVLVCLNAFRFGRLDVLYRNNINTWFCDELDLPELVAQAGVLSQDLSRLVTARPIHDALAAHFDRKRIDVAQVPLHAWTNPNSLAPTRGADYRDNRQTLASGAPLRAAILKAQGVEHPPRPVRRGPGP